VTLLDWPTETFSIDHLNRSTRPHTVLVFVPGNPGLVDWYITFFSEILCLLGPGFCARGAANAGHSIDPERIINASSSSFSSTKFVSWTIDGQVRHKMAFVDHLTQDLGCINFMFVSHSIGAHFTQRMCVLRPDILQRTTLLIHLMPFIVMKRKYLLDLGASYPSMTIDFHGWMVKCLAMLPMEHVDWMMRNIMSDDEGRQIATSLIRQPAFVHNFFRLGLEELRDVPQVVDASALRVLGSCPTALLFAENDFWCPESLIQEIASLQQRREIPSNISITQLPQLQHDFVSQTDQTPLVVDFCIGEIRKVVNPASKL
jgi:pimeloyl-ACP methyl ester carboxylesterase